MQIWSFLLIFSGSSFCFRIISTAYRFYCCFFVCLLFFFGGGVCLLLFFPSGSWNSDQSFDPSYISFLIRTLYLSGWLWFLITLDKAKKQKTNKTFHSSKWPPLTIITASQILGILSIKDWRLTEDSVAQLFWKCFQRWAALVGCLVLSFRSSLSNTSSIGLSSLIAPAKTSVEERAVPLCF